MQYFRKIFWGIILFLVLSVVTQAQEPLPLPEQSMFPEPTGNYQVGRRSYHWVDKSRDESNTDEEDNRELMVTVWYPADVEDGSEMAVYLEDLNGSSAGDVRKLLHISSDDPFANAMAELKIYAYQDAPVSEAESSYPILVFSHGFGNVASDYSLQLVELASHGYIVFAINHTYYSGVSVFPDGRVIGLSFGAGKVKEFEITGSEDLLFVLDQLERLNTDDENFADKLDLDKIGVFGHSSGGAIAVLAASMDTRIKAVVNEDEEGTFPTIEQPLMFFSSGTETHPVQELNYVVVVDDFEHMSFADFSALVPDVDIFDSERRVEIIRVYLLDFFNKYLKGEDSELLDEPSEAYPEVSVRTENTG